ncbi:MAG TPA: DUF3048 domain-containing protein [Nocardioidaceae bacterium]|nr:DUF3048 domain-containing protein [Nocardioidaceae bacterium]
MTRAAAHVSRRRHLGPRGVGLALATALALAGCSGSGKDSDEDPDGQSTAAGLTLSGQWPLTGLPAKGAAPKHPVMVVKIDNTSASSPQVGLGKADLVTEELVEGGSTRLAVFYYSRVPQRVGPVRSFRATDIGIVKPAEAVLIASGGAPPTVRRMRESKIRTFTEGAQGYSRDSSRVSPYDLFMNLSSLARTLKSEGAPDNYLPWGSQEDFPSGVRANGLSAQFSASHSTTWEYRGGRYVNVNSFAAEPDRFDPKIVLVLRVKVGDAGYKDPAGNPVPETIFTGKGQALVFHGGKVVRGSWSKAGLEAPVKLLGKDGELTLPSGRVWIELVPANGGNVTINR